MPQYAPLPPIELDPRNESELVAAAAQRVFEASGATINDFSSGSPIMALLEGQAFAQAELLAFANQFPEAVLVEWIGPFLGAQRRTGSSSVVELEFTIAPRSQDFVVFTGFEATTDPNLTGGESITFVTTDRLVIPPGEDSGRVRAVSLFRGSNSNVARNTIVRAATSLAGILSVSNPEAAAGGSDPELLSEVKERFFTLIRRRNPVSAEDWEGFFSDALGPGTAVTVLPRRSEKDAYAYDRDFEVSAPAVSFFVLNPDGSPLTSAQRSSLQGLLKFALPTEFTGVVYSKEVDNVDVSLDIAYDPNRPYSQDLLKLSESVRNALSGILTPNAVFPVDYEPSVSDVEGALTTALPIVLGLDTQFVDPNISSLQTFTTPYKMSEGSFSVTAPKEFVSGETFSAGDLVINERGIISVFYEVLRDFSPITGSKSYHANIKDLAFTLIKPLISGPYRLGDVISVVGETGATLHVVKSDFTYTTSTAASELIARGLVTSAKGLKDWGRGVEISAFDSDDNYDPDLIIFERSDLNNEVHIPALPTFVDKERRAGYPVWVARENFVVSPNLADIGTATAAGFVGAEQVEAKLLSEGSNFIAGDFLVTPSPEQIITRQIPEDACYISELKGLVRVYARALTDFTFNDLRGRSYSEAFDELVDSGVIQVIQVHRFLDCAGRSLFSDSPFRYKARFALGEYLRYRPLGGFDAGVLESCTVQSEQCEVISPTCRRLIESNLPLPRYFQALRDFTPTTQDPDEMVSQGFIIEVPAQFFRPTYVIEQEQIPLFFKPENITEILKERGTIANVEDLALGETARIIGPAEEDLGTFFWSESGWMIRVEGLPEFRDMFRFAPGDAASFRSGSEIRQYEATEHVTPVADLRVYHDHEVFIRSDREETVKYYDPRYRYEDVVLERDRAATRFYRAISSFTPASEVTTWVGATENSPRSEEVFGSLLKITVEASCDERVRSRLGSQVSALKLGVFNIRLVSKGSVGSGRTFVWESSESRDIQGELSFSTGLNSDFKPVNYGRGTLAL